MQIQQEMKVHMCGLWKLVKIDEKLCIHTHIKKAVAITNYKITEEFIKNMCVNV